MQRYRLRCAVFLLLTKQEAGRTYLLLQRRYQTGVLDGQYDLSCSGHLEKGETLTEAVIREAKEEIGIDLREQDLHYSSTMIANFKGTEYLFVAFQADQYRGIPMIMEPDKCDQLAWYDIKALPRELIDTRKMMVELAEQQRGYSDYGF